MLRGETDSEPQIGALSRLPADRFQVIADAVDLDLGSRKENDNTMLEPLFWLLVGHAMGDFGLQSDWMARYKNRHLQGASVFSSKPELIWLEVLSAHCLIHAGAVALATGSIFLGLLEFVAHGIIDFCKCEDYFGFHTDQCLHIACKFVWFIMLTQGWLI